MVDFVETLAVNRYIFTLYILLLFILKDIVNRNRKPISSAAERGLRRLNIKTFTELNSVISSFIIRILEKETLFPICRRKAKFFRFKKIFTRASLRF
jgi:hypothetical protein